MAGENPSWGAVRINAPSRTSAKSLPTPRSATSSGSTAASPRRRGSGSRPGRSSSRLIGTCSGPSTSRRSRSGQDRGWSPSTCSSSWKWAPVACASPAARPIRTGDGGSRSLGIRGCPGGQVRIPAAVAHRNAVFTLRDRAAAPLRAVAVGSKRAESERPEEPAVPRLLRFGRPTDSAPGTCS
jgi:hypothetical protein